MITSHSKQLLVFLAVLTLIFGAAWYFLYGAIAESASADQERISQQTAADAATNQDQSLAAFLTDSSSTASTLLASVLPADGSVSFIEQVENVAKKENVGLHVGGVSLSAPTDIPSTASGFEDLDLSLSVQGSWASVYQFIATIESFPYRIDVTNVSINQSIYGTGKQTQSFWSGSISLLVLKVKSADEATK
jgi:Tfp pilus assembly protein PilO